MYHAKLQDPAVTPSFFGFFEDFLGGSLVDATAVVTQGRTIANIGTPTAAETEQAVSTLASTFIGGGLTFTSVTSGTIAVSEANGGWVKISGAATTDDSGGSVQSRGAFNFTTNKRVSFKARALLSDATESDLWIGLFNTDASIIAGVTDGVWFQKTDGAASIACKWRDASGTIGSYSVPTTVFTPDTSAHTYGISVIPKGTNNANTTLIFFIDGVAVYTTEVEVSLSTVIMSGSVAFQSGTATGTIYCEVDYIGVSQDR